MRHRALILNRRSKCSKPQQKNPANLKSGGEGSSDFETRLAGEGGLATVDSVCFDQRDELSLRSLATLLNHDTTYSEPGML
jgi:hypothetical protein